MTDQTPTCQQCGKPLKSGRIDKKFCNEGCRNQYHNAQKIAEHAEIKKINGIIKKNRRILRSLLGDNKFVNIGRDELLKKGFEFDYLTHYVTTKTQGNEYAFIYNYGYHEFEPNKFKIVKSFT